MDMQEMKRIFTSNEGMMLTIMFTMIFIVTNLIMEDVRGVQGLMTAHGQTPFFILVMLTILAYLFKNSIGNKQISGRIPGHLESVCHQYVGPY